MTRMIYESHPIVNGILGTCFTWFVTALGAGVVYIVPDGLAQTTERKVLDLSLGFAGGVMLAASFWSLLTPAIELAEELEYGMYSIVPVVIGLVAGAVFVSLADVFLPEDVMVDVQAHQEKSKAVAKSKKNDDIYDNEKESKKTREKTLQRQSLRRMFLLVIAVTIHNFPEGLAVGVAFGAVGTSPSATFQSACILALGIGIQNFPEGLAVSLPMRRMGMSKGKCFFYGQLSGMVETIGGFLGAASVQLAKPALPYALSFAAGAMIYVVFDSIIPEGQSFGNGVYTTWGGIVGFITMMVLDVCLG